MWPIAIRGQAPSSYTILRLHIFSGLWPPLGQYLEASRSGLYVVRYCYSRVGRYAGSRKQPSAEVPHVISSNALYDAPHQHPFLEETHSIDHLKDIVHDPSKCQRQPFRRRNECWRTRQTPTATLNSPFPLRKQRRDGSSRPGLHHRRDSNSARMAQRQAQASQRVNLKRRYWRS